VVIEAELSKGRGPVATVLVQEGTLNRGDIVVAGKAMGRVRAMIDDRGRASRRPVRRARSRSSGSTTCRRVGDPVLRGQGRARGEAIVESPQDKERKGRCSRTSVEGLARRPLRAHPGGRAQDAQPRHQGGRAGLARSAAQRLLEAQAPELKVRIIHDAVGAISEHDVNLASASNAHHHRLQRATAEKNAKDLAEQDKVDIKLYSVIYNAVDDVKAAMEGMLKPNIEEKFVGRAAVRETFSIPKFGTIAGCAVLQGKLIRNAKARLIRDGRVVNDGKIDTLRRFKDQVTEVERGHECGVHLENFNDVKIGDEIECYELIEIAQKLELSQ
jgi:translation initiation factor IF-2